MPVLLSAAFCAPVEYYAAIAADLTLAEGRGNSVFRSVAPARVWIEAAENYQKQSWRNRCTICTANGPENISVPIVHRNGSHNNIPITEVEVDYGSGWVQKAERAIVSAYSMSPFFEYYRDSFFDILASRPVTLFELDMKFLEYFLRQFGIPASIHLTRAYGEVPEAVADLREVIHPKRPNTILQDLGLKKPYYQVFSCKHGFIEGMSAMDLLFNEGPESLVHLCSLS